MNDQDEGVDDALICGEFSDPRLVAVYDTVNPIAEYETFYLDLAAKLSASSIIDIGCGTGLLTCELAKRGHRPIGVEPSNARLALARRRHCGEQVEWIEGDALRLGEVGADLAIMTGHVAQMEQRLGEISGRIVGEVFFGLVEGDPNTFLSKEPDWKPKLPSRAKDNFTMGDLLRPVGEIKPLRSS